jgi:hypothetical protein
MNTKKILAVFILFMAYVSIFWGLPLLSEVDKYLMEVLCLHLAIFGVFAIAYPIAWAIFQLDQ